MGLRSLYAYSWKGNGGTYHHSAVMTKTKNEDVIIMVNYNENYISVGIWQVDGDCYDHAVKIIELLKKAIITYNNEMIAMTILIIISMIMLNSHSPQRKYNRKP